MSEGEFSFVPVEKPTKPHNIELFQQPVSMIVAEMKSGQENVNMGGQSFKEVGFMKYVRSDATRKDDGSYKARTTYALNPDVLVTMSQLVPSLANGYYTPERRTALADHLKQQGYQVQVKEEMISKRQPERRLKTDAPVYSLELSIDNSLPYELYLGYASAADEEIMLLDKAKNTHREARKRQFAAQLATHEYTGGINKYITLTSSGINAAQDTAQLTAQLQQYERIARDAFEALHLEAEAPFPGEDLQKLTEAI
ncbi:hypothetical protein BH09PAT2_BH09PAT2_07130 [soil metagenome]